MSEPCILCGRPVEDYEPKMCCSGYMCGCMGQPMEPCVCSKECSDAVFNHIGKTMEERRIAAGIAFWEEPQIGIEAAPEIDLNQKIKTHYVNPPIPVRELDWMAWIDGQEEDGPYGQGATEAEAIADLKIELEARE